MKEIKLPDSELKVMDVIWEKGEASAKETAQCMGERYGWKKNTTYTVLKNLHEKGILERIEPGFLCRPLVGREQVGRTEVKNLLNRFYQGSPAALFASFLEQKTISREELDEIKDMIDRFE